MKVTNHQYSFISNALKDLGSKRLLSRLPSSTLREFNSKADSLSKEAVEFQEGRGSGISRRYFGLQGIPRRREVPRG